MYTTIGNYYSFQMTVCCAVWIGTIHLKRIISTKCCIHTVVPPDDGPRYARNLQILTKYTENKLCIELVFLYSILSICTVNKTQNFCTVLLFINLDFILRRVITGCIKTFELLEDIKLFNKLYHISVGCNVDDVAAHQGCYANYVSSYLPTFRYSLSVPSSRVKQIILGLLLDIVEERRCHLKRGGSSKHLTYCRFGISQCYLCAWEPGVAQWLRRCATSRTIPGQIPVMSLGIFFRGSFRQNHVS